MVELPHWSHQWGARALADAEVVERPTVPSTSKSPAMIEGTRPLFATRCMKFTASPSEIALVGKLATDESARSVGYGHEPDALVRNSQDCRTAIRARAYNDDPVSEAWRNHDGVRRRTEALKTLEPQRDPSIEVSVCYTAPLSAQTLLPNSPRNRFSRRLHRGSDYGSEGRGFKSSWAYQSPNALVGASRRAGVSSRRLRPSCASEAWPRRAPGGSPLRGSPPAGRRCPTPW